jgi:hypothetical protein
VVFVSFLGISAAAEPPPTPVSFTLATAETLASNLALYGTNVLVVNPYFRQDSSFPSTPETRRRNLTADWTWDSDGFGINQFLHPYQGVAYHAAGRANGFTFYQSLGFDALGSITWELFAETDYPAANDFLASTFAGAAFGEMLHRLYVEAADTHPYLAAPVSPLDALNRAVTKRRPAARGSIYDLSLYAGIGWYHAARTDGDGTAAATWNVPIPVTGIHVVYGDPFLAAGSVPYDHFELTMEGPNFTTPWSAYPAKILSDGYLFSFQARDNGRTAATTGLTLHWDFFMGAHEEYYGQALDWTWKMRHELHAAVLELRAHAGWTAFASAYFFTDENSWWQNYSTGVNGKVSAAVTTARFGSVSLSAFLYHNWVLPHTVPDSEGRTFTAFFDAAYRFPLTRAVTVALEDSLYLEHGTYARVPDVRRWTNQTRATVRIRPSP